LIQEHRCTGTGWYRNNLVQEQVDQVRKEQVGTGADWYRSRSVQGQFGTRKSGNKAGWYRRQVGRVAELTGAGWYRSRSVQEQVCTGESGYRAGCYRRQVL
jgi:hypothetical protein